ncbi:hypothetical protein SAMN04515691_0960 [Leifsonia sp. 98AMF]|uniref:hypothetical protein n=1 Tax=unclassified Leifsonia TaxID=2663824 RepID=UPI00087B684A|nr:MULTISPECIES: hypothetical protein [unclassified Leifsonia]SDH56014.1 hypothetical protein SAMN04515690_3060 [Leifsonia sp. 197AMF]SDI82928.1 hypothetical protein SAMN04515684_0728 [Leifsonia sp. 466MF]SDK01073.1 hypothetical protein SAMN04515683_2021 [Leifsonia sp. 157MF]SDN86028.1 hypothetical protein SAMN04515686_2930 [Leifsonia sp. 509MF]SEN20215.1 hypothetical protein SAMN04515685_2006 [Leifsonia sp. 467MF]
MSADPNTAPAPRDPARPDTGTPARGGWREPASLLPLRWGAYRPRLIVGLAMLVVGTACVLGTTTYSLTLLLIGSLMQPAGWAVLPSTIGRRVAVPLPVLGFTWLMLGGSGFAWCYAVVLAAWLLVRLRPLPSFAVLVLPVAWSVLLPLFVHDYEHGWITIATSTAVIVGGAWLAKWIAIRFDSWQSVRTLRKEPRRFD